MVHAPDIRSLVESFTNNIAQLMRRAALEEVHAKLSLAIGETVPKRRGPGRPRKAKTATATAAVPQKEKGGKRTAADLGAMSDALFAHVKTNPGQRGEQIAAALGTDVGTMRLPMQKLIAEKKVRTEGQRRGTTYFAGAKKAKRAAPKRKRAARKAKPARKAKAGKRKKPATRGTIKPQSRPVEVAPVVAAPIPVEVS